MIFFTLRVARSGTERDRRVECALSPLQNPERAIDESEAIPRWDFAASLAPSSARVDVCGVYRAEGRNARRPVGLRSD